MIKRTLLGLTVLGAFSAAFSGGIDQPTNPWMLYMGGFGGYYNASYHNSSVYTSQGNVLGIPTNQVFGADAYQNGGLGGVQLGLQYHYHSPYYSALVLSYQWNTNKARLGLPVDNNVSGGNQFPFVMNNSFSIARTFDIASVFGIDITNLTQAYFKLGASYANFRYELANTQSGRVAEPITAFTTSQNRNIWGGVVGVGLSHSFNSWLNLFGEYNYYDYGRINLNILQNIGVSLAPGASDSLTQHHVHMQASAVKLGLNIKFMDDRFAKDYLAAVTSPWMAYVGVFTGYNAVNFKYGALYSSVGGFNGAVGGGAGNQLVNNDLLQNGVLGGAQFGLQYHLRCPYFFGLSVGYTRNANTAKYSQAVDNAVTPTPNPQFWGYTLTNTMRNSNVVDITPLFGFDINEWNHPYVKVGASYASLKHGIETVQMHAAIRTIYGFQGSEDVGLWGWVFGLGLAHDFNRWVNFFAEYDYYGYGKNHLQTRTNIAPNRAPAGSDELTQNVTPYASVFRFGMNLKFMDHNLAPMQMRKLADTWLFYLGGFGGYYGAQFQYGSTYFGLTGGFGPPQLVITNTNLYQRGVSGGVQIGGQYHFSQPYAIGLAFSYVWNTNKPRVVASFGDTGLNSQQTVALQVKQNLDITPVFAIDITESSHLYVKGGVSYARFNSDLNVTQVSTPSPTSFFSVSEDKRFWGWVGGVGLTHDFNKVVNIFAEYDYYEYGGKFNLRGYNLAPAFGDSFNQHFTVHANAFRIGLNLLNY